MPIRLLIVDDSPYYRLRYSKIFARSEAISVVGLADDGDVAIRKIVELDPDILLLDLVMPRMDGFGVLRWAMENHPLPVVVCSSFSDRERVFKALELGAVDFLLKPAPRSTPQTSDLELEVVDRVEQAARARTTFPQGFSKDAKAAVVAAEKDAREAAIEVICVAASTGGPAAIQRLVAALPRSLTAPIIVVQHMPMGFTGRFAERLNGLSHYTVREACDGDSIRRRHLYVAPGGKHATVDIQEGVKVMRITAAGSRSPQVPSADTLFASAAEIFGPAVLAVVLTGMGEDGTRGARAVRAAGGHVLAESNESAVVFGMPRAVLESGCANAMLPLGAMPQLLLAYALKD